MPMDMGRCGGRLTCVLLSQTAQFVQAVLARLPWYDTRGRRNSGEISEEKP